MNRDQLIGIGCMIGMGIAIPTVIHIGIVISFEGSDALQEYAL